MDLGIKWMTATTTESDVKNLPDSCKPVSCNTAMSFVDMSKFAVIECLVTNFV